MNRLSRQTTELNALVEELMDLRRLDQAQAIAEARRIIDDLAVEALAWDADIEQTRAELAHYAAIWDRAAGQQRARARVSRRTRLAA